MILFFLSSAVLVDSLVAIWHKGNSVLLLFNMQNAVLILTMKQIMVTQHSTACIVLQRAI